MRNHDGRGEKEGGREAGKGKMARGRTTTTTTQKVTGGKEGKEGGRKGGREDTYLPIADQGDGDPLGAEATGATHAMDVRLRRPVFSG